MNPEEKHGLSKFYFQADDGEMKPINAAVTEIKIEPSYELIGIDWGRPNESITSTFTSNVRKMSPSLAIYFKRVSALGFVYIDDIRNLI